MCCPSHYNDPADTTTPFPFRRSSLSVYLHENSNTIFQLLKAEITRIRIRITVPDEHDDALATALVQAMGPCLRHLHL